MKTISKTLFLTVTVLMSVSTTYSQIDNGGLHAGFGIDGDSKAGYLKFGPLTGSVASDDWFGPTTGSFTGVIDTTNAAFYKSQLQSNKNISFSKRMIAPLYGKVNNRLWLDGIYFRDYVISDSSSFSGGSKNGDDPANWSTGTTAVPSKSDLLDVFAHMRRDGPAVTDSLWLYTAVSTIGTSGTRFFDIELYKNNVSFSSGNFSTGGPDAGHTQWKFDASGNIIQTGDLIISVNYAGGDAPIIDIRIWVSNVTFSTITPAIFNFGSSFNGTASGGSLGYANIVSKSGTVMFGSGLANYSLLTITDTTTAAPWGTASPIGLWSLNYSSLQFVEIGLNLTRIGVDPASYTALGSSPCDGIYSSILFKSRASSSFTASLHDFVGPLDFINLPALNYSVKTDTISCAKPNATLSISNNSLSGHFTWTSIGGNILSANADSTQVVVDKTGKYVLQASQKDGCPIKGTDTLTVIADSLQPVASIGIGANNVGQAQLYGGDTAASNQSTPFGRSKGLTWSWTGPNGFTSSIQNPVINSNWGTYNLSVAETRNGCTSTASYYASFSVLPLNKFPLIHSMVASTVKLEWESTGLGQMEAYVVEKRQSNDEYQPVGIIRLTNYQENFSFTDEQFTSDSYYRVKAVAKNGSIYYSNELKVIKDNPVKNKAYIFKSGNNLTLVTNSSVNGNATVVVRNSSGGLLTAQPVTLTNGRSTSVISTELMRNKIVLVTLYIDNALAFTQKIVL
jgi:hypothetical protein